MVHSNQPQQVQRVRLIILVWSGFEKNISETTGSLSSTKLKSTRSSSSNRSKSPNSTTRRTTTSSY